MTGKYNPNLIRLVSLLNDGEYHDGTQLGELLKMTRSAVWKMIKKLQAYGIEIESVKGKGYRLCESLVLLDPSCIKAKVYLHESIDSTNIFLKSLRNQKTISYCLAERQTEGKGRLERKWHSPFGKNIYFSCLYPIQKDISELGGLSLVVSLAVVSTLKQFMPDDLLGVKWPNDVLYDGKKISGTLIELKAESNGLCQAIIGIGINVNMKEDEANISQTWTSIQKITGHYIDRNKVCQVLLENLNAKLNQFIENGFESFAKEWAAVDCLAGKSISLTNLNHRINGVMEGVNSQGHLLMKMSDGITKVFSSGDASQVRESAVSEKTNIVKNNKKGV